MASSVTLDPQVARTFIKYARLVSARGYVHNTLGNIVIRVPHPEYPHGVAYTNHAELSLEEMEPENIVIVRRNIAAELLAARAGTQPRYRGQAEIEAMYRFAESIIYPKRAERVMHED
jgi:ribulose-5-phosphate 4-epimerase/fuculose-1-phosphate aldolase